MKRVYFVMVFVSVLLCACSAERLSVNTERIVIMDGTVFTIDTEDQTITDGSDIYRFSADGNRITITYPNGATYSWFAGGYGSSSGNYDESRYVSGMTLGTVLSQVKLQQTDSNYGLLLFGMICSAIGLWNTISPNSVWYLRRGWQYRNAEPSDAALGLTRLGGILVIIIGVIAFLAGLSC